SITPEEELCGADYSRDSDGVQKHSTSSIGSVNEEDSTVDPRKPQISRHEGLPILNELGIQIQELTDLLKILIQSHRVADGDEADRMTLQPSLEIMESLLGGREALEPKRSSGLVKLKSSARNMQRPRMEQAGLILDSTPEHPESVGFAALPH